MGQSASLLAKIQIKEFGLDKSRYAGDLERLKEMIKTDPDLVVPRCRVILETCLNLLYRSSIGSPGRKSLANLIAELASDGFLPKKIKALCEAVRELGNVGAHPILDTEELTYAEAQVALSSLMIVLEWSTRIQNEMNLATIIHNKRKQKRITQKELAKQIGVSQSYLSKLEKGEVKPSLKSIQAISDSLGISPSVIMAACERE